MSVKIWEDGHIVKVIAIAKTDTSHTPKQSQRIHKNIPAQNISLKMGHKRDTNSIYMLENYGNIWSFI